MTYIKRSAKVPFGSSRYGFGKGVWGGLGLQAMRTKSVLVLIYGCRCTTFTHGRMDEKEKSRKGRNVR